MRLIFFLFSLSQLFARKSKIRVSLEQLQGCFTDFRH
jgi:hypothetical protein